MTPSLSDRRVLVLGGAGYLGSVLTGQLLDAGYRVTVFDVCRFGAESLDALRGRPGFELVQGDLRDVAAVSAHVRDAGAVILLASLVGEPDCDQDPKATIDVNYVATMAAAHACRHWEVPRFVFASTDSAYGIQEGIMTEEQPLNPISLYARLKMRVEQDLLRVADERFRPIILRMATNYGLSPRMRFDLIVNVLTLHAVTRGTITVHGGKQWRPLVHVADAARAYVMALEAPLETVGAQIFNVGSNEQNYQIGELGELVSSVYPEVAVDTVPRPPDLRDYHVSFDKIGRALGYRVQRTVVDGIREIGAALRERRIADPAHPRHYNFVSS